MSGSLPSEDEVLRTRLESLWNRVETRVMFEGIAFVRTESDAVQARAMGHILGKPFQLTQNSDPDEFEAWAHGKVVNYAGRGNGNSALAEKR